jgi:hypothetical protein
MKTVNQNILFPSPDLNQGPLKHEAGTLTPGCIPRFVYRARGRNYTALRYIIFFPAQGRPQERAHRRRGPGAYAHSQGHPLYFCRHANVSAYLHIKALQGECEVLNAQEPHYTPLLTTKPHLLGHEVDRGLTSEIWRPVVR